MALALALAETERERGSEAQVQHSPRSNNATGLHSDLDGHTGQLLDTGRLLVCSITSRIDPTIESCCWMQQAARVQRLQSPHLGSTRMTGCSELSVSDLVASSTQGSVTL